MLFIVKEKQPHYPPKIIDKIRIKEIHAPPRFWWRETAKKKDFPMGWQKGFQRMFLNSHMIKEKKGLHQRATPFFRIGFIYFLMNS
jgi:hypothetical protein